jgi:hypothetical protein
MTLALSRFSFFNLDWLFGRVVRVSPPAPAEPTADVDDDHTARALLLNMMTSHPEGLQSETSLEMMMSIYRGRF